MDPDSPWTTSTPISSTRAPLALDWTRGVLWDFGNMSSATVLLGF